MARYADTPGRCGAVTAAWAACLVVSLGLTGCAGSPATPTPTPTLTAPAISGGTAAPAAPAAPELVPNGTAGDNQPYFDAVIAAAIAAEANPGGRGYIDALTAAGFDRSQMEVTADTTTQGEPADSLQFSVRFNGECIIGQNGPSSGGYHSMVAAILGSGTCLVGATRQIDW